MKTPEEIIENIETQNWPNDEDIIEFAGYTYPDTLDQSYATERAICIHAIKTCRDTYFRKLDKEDELLLALKTQLKIIKALIGSKRIVNLDESIAYYEKLLQSKGIKIE